MPVLSWQGGETQPGIELGGCCAAVGWRGPEPLTSRESPKISKSSYKEVQSSSESREFILETGTGDVVPPSASQ